MIPQIIVNGLIAGLLFSLVALGFSIIYSATKVFHIAHGAMYTATPYLFIAISLILHPNPYSFWLVLGITLLAVVGLALLCEVFVYRPLLVRAASPLVFFISSMGFYSVVVNLIGLSFGNETKVLNPGVQAATTLGPIIITRVQIIQTLVSIATLSVVLIILKKTSIGRDIRALSDNQVLLSVLGLNAKKIRLVVFALGSTLAAIACLLRAFDVGIQPNAGLPITLTATVAVIIGGVGSHFGAVLSAILLGIAQNLVAGFFLAEWSNALTFVLFIFVLLYRSRGLLSSAIRLEEQ